MAIRIPEFNTQMSTRVPDANTVSVGSAEADAFRLAGDNISKMGEELKNRALAQAKSSQMLKAKEAYLLRMTDTAVKAELDIDPFTGKVGKQANADIFSDYMAKSADRTKDDVKREFIDDSWKSEFDEMISPTHTGIKTGAIVKQADYTTTGAKQEQVSLKNIELKNLAGYNDRLEPGIDEAIKTSLLLQANVEKSVISGNLPRSSQMSYIEDSTYSVGKIAKENVELTGNLDDAFMLLGTDFALDEKTRAKIQAEIESGNGGAFQKILSDFENKRQAMKVDLSNPKSPYAQRYASAQKNIPLNAEDKLDLIKNLLKNKLNNIDASKKTVDNQIHNIVAQLNDSYSRGEPHKEVEAMLQIKAQGKAMLANGSPKTDVYDTVSQAYTTRQVQHIVNKYATEPSAVRRSHLGTIEAQVKKQILKDFPEMADAFIKNPTLGSRVGEMARNALDQADEALTAEFKKNKEDFAYNHFSEVKNKWAKVTKRGAGNPALAQQAVEATAKAIKKIGGYYALSEAELQHGLVPNQIASAVQFEVENAAAKGDYAALFSIIKGTELNGTASGIAYKIEKNIEKSGDKNNPLKGISHMINTNDNFKKQIILAKPGYASTYKLIGDNTSAKSPADWKEAEREMQSTVLSKMHNYVGIQGQNGEANRMVNEILDKTKMIYTYRAEQELGQDQSRADLVYEKEKFEKVAEEVFANYYKPFKTETSYKDFFTAGAPVKGLFSLPAAIGPAKEPEDIQKIINEEFKALKSETWKDIDTSSKVFQVLENDILVQSAKTTFGVTKGTITESPEVRQKKVIDYFAEKKKIFYAAPIENEHGSVRPYIDLNGQKYEIPFKNKKGHIPFKRFAK